MGTKPVQKISQPKGSFEDLVDVADVAILRQLVCQIGARRPDVRRECVEFLQKTVTLSRKAIAGADGEIALALWDELESDLSELDEYGGGPRDVEYKVADLLCELAEKLNKSAIPRDDRQSLLDEVLPFIKSRNSGMEDSLYDVAYAACQDDEDLRYFAQQLETFGQDWSTDHARRIYRRIGDSEKYLALRLDRMEYGADYHDLATFHWDQGDREKALAVAHEGQKKAKGRMDELREFLASRAKESGARESYVDIKFQQATDRLTLARYKAFRKLCTAKEWKSYESQMVAALDDTPKGERLKIHMHRKEYDQAVDILSAMRYPDTRYGDGDLLKTAAQLETKYPEKILAFYRLGLGKLNQNATRETYARWANIAKKIRHMWVDVIKDPQQWATFAKKAKQANCRRPAFQEEFSKAIPGWKEL